MLKSYFRILLRNEAGASAVEYALLISLVGVICFGALSYLGRETGNSFGNTAEKIAANSPGESAVGNRGALAGGAVGAQSAAGDSHAGGSAANGGVGNNSGATGGAFGGSGDSVGGSANGSGGDGDAEHNGGNSGG